MRKLALPFALALVLAACGGSQEPAKPAAAPEAPKPAAPAAPAPAEAPAATAATSDWDKQFSDVLSGYWRSDANKARDVYRHPRETLAFFGLKPTSVVVELTPGGGWYTEILAPLVKKEGKLVAAVVDATTAEKEGTRNYLGKSNTAFKDKLKGDTDRYSAVEVREFPMSAPSFGPAGTADLVVTFRNVHNFMMWKNDQAVFKAAFDVLKPGGVLGVTDHRAAAGADLEKIKTSGYITEDYVIKLATDAGFQLAEKSEINANPKDTKDYAEGVWTLPPSYALGDKDKEKYAAIGESDRMTLKFVKPATAAAAAATPTEPVKQ